MDFTFSDQQQREMISFHLSLSISVNFLEKNVV